jgi:transposase
MSSKVREEKLTGRRIRRNYTEEFRRDAVGMIDREGLKASEVSRRLGVNVNLLRKWREKYGKGSPVVEKDVNEELRQLREENRLKFPRSGRRSGFDVVDSAQRVVQM